ncbi:adenosylmethionine decarboxylase [Telmatospirillum sp. J64-1]|uniref:adenosylmethionine decarboxylase n=1 Tax=Telmatospirillum sp. J64-1 TaxID=2502183 RepID=UPI002107F199|nr:adenosylmethionine decarboxylase [Telmatospirillum sp. J64-1]
MAKVSLATQLGMHSEANPSFPKDTTARNDEGQSWPVVDNGKDYFIERNGIKYAGVHLLIDLWGASKLDNIEVIEAALRESAEIAGATLLHCHLHHFSPNGGVSGVLVLAESHISIHTWPERNYAALDVFMCGDCDPWKAIPVLKKAFTPDNVVVAEQKRGIIA